MSLLQDVRAKARHRGLTPWQLVQKIGCLEREADDAACRMVAMATEIDELRAERDRLAEELDTTQVDLAVVREDRDDWRDEVLALRARFGAQIAAEANANAVTVPPMVRDTTAIEDQATGPIDVRTLWAARDAGLLGPVVDPGHVTTP